MGLFMHNGQNAARHCNRAASCRIHWGGCKMASQQTEHYGLNQWAGKDDFLRTEFNEDNRKVDGALAGLQNGKCEVVFGTYTGTGEARAKVELGFTPALLITADDMGHMGDGGGAFGGIAMPGHPVRHGGGVPALEIVDGGFRVGYEARYSLSTNTESQEYFYLAVR